MSILNDSFITQVYTSYVDLASFSRRVSAREPCGQFWDENEKLCRALASILLGSRCPEKHGIESKLIGTIFALGITFHSVSRTPHFWCRSIIYLLSFPLKLGHGFYYYFLKIGFARECGTLEVKSFSHSRFFGDVFWRFWFLAPNRQKTSPKNLEWEKDLTSRVPHSLANPILRK